MCKTISYCSINNTQQKYHNLKKTFGDHYSLHKNWPDYEWNLQYWITKYKFDNDKNIVYYFRDQSVNSYDDYITDLKI